MRIPRDISVWFLCEASQLLIEHCSHPSAADGATLPRHLHRIFLAALLCLEPLSEGFSRGMWRGGSTATASSLCWWDYSKRSLLAAASSLGGSNKGCCSRARLPLGAGGGGTVSKQAINFLPARLQQSGSQTAALWGVRQQGQPL